MPAVPRPTVIHRAARAARELGFEQLREQAIALLRDSSREQWTDHNLHDPGITVMEQLCFGLSELLYQAERPVPDHLAGLDGELDYAALGLHPPHQAFPCRATTAEDHRRVLLDGVAELDDVHLEPASDAWPGLWRMELALDTASSDTTAPRRRALALARAQRGLGEDFDETLDEVGVVRCELLGEVDISGPRDAGEIAAEIYQVVARCIARTTPLAGRAELLAQGLGLEQIYDGPAVSHGLAVADSHTTRRGKSLVSGASREDRLYIADLIERVAAIDGVKTVLRLQLRTRLDGIVDTDLPWRTPRADGGHDALRLVLPGNPRDWTEPALQLRRRSHVLQVRAEELWRRVQDLRAAERAQRLRLAQATRREEHEALPTGVPLGATRYHSVQHHFPALYGLGTAGVPPSAGPAAMARARQLRAYLALAEQHIANGQAQVQHLARLFRADTVPTRSYWWRPLTGKEADVPGMQDLWIQPDKIEADVFEPLDRSSLRKSRLLDHLLALHGERYGQNAMRPFCAHLSADEQDAFLLRNKQAWLEDVVALSRHRAGGFDHSRPWSHVNNTSGLARRAALLLGFANPQARLLCRGQAFGGGGGFEPNPAQRQAALRLDLPPPAPPEPQAGPLPKTLPLAPALLRAATAHDKWHLLPQPGGKDLLVLGPDEAGRWWRMRRLTYPTQDTQITQAAAVAAALRQRLLARNDAAEGLHLVEHLLLRPLSPGVAAHPGLKLPPDFFGLRVTALLPDWTVRTRQLSFRTLAEETLRINCPVHLMLSVRWLNFGQMQGFERDWRQWLHLRACHARPRPQPRYARRLGADPLARIDAAACAVLRWLFDEPASPPAAPPSLQATIEDNDG